MAPLCGDLRTFGTDVREGHCCSPTDLVPVCVPRADVVCALFHSQLGGVIFREIPATHSRGLLNCRTLVHNSLFVYFVTDKTL